MINFIKVSSGYWNCECQISRTGSILWERFSYFREIFKNTFFIEHPRETASGMFCFSEKDPFEESTYYDIFVSVFVESGMKVKIRVLSGMVKNSLTHRQTKDPPPYTRSQNVTANGKISLIYPEESSRRN